MKWLPIPNSWFTVSVPVHSLLVDVPCSPREVILIIQNCKADWVSWHAEPVVFDSIWIDVHVLCRPLLDSEVPVSCFNKRPFCWQCFCTSGAVTKRHSLILWHPGNHMKYVSAFVRLTKMHPFGIPIRMSHVSAVKKKMSLIWAVDTQLFMLLFNGLIIPSTLAVFQQSLVSFCRRAFMSAQRVPLVLSPLSSLIKGSELEAWHPLQQIHKHC